MKITENKYNKVIRGFKEKLLVNGICKAIIIIIIVITPSLKASNLCFESSLENFS